MSLSKFNRSYYGMQPKDQKIYNQKREINKLEKQNKQLLEIIEKTKGKLYCWGEVLELEFQKEMLEILERDSDK